MVYISSLISNRTEYCAEAEPSRVPYRARKREKITKQEGDPAKMCRYVCAKIKEVEKTSHEVCNLHLNLETHE